MALVGRGSFFLKGTLAERPAFGRPGLSFYATDEGIQYLDIGTSWVVSDGSSAPNEVLYAATGRITLGTGDHLAGSTSGVALDHGIALGFNALASNIGDIAIGSSAQVDLGSGTRANVVIGYGSYARGEGIVLIGAGTFSNSLSGGTAIGSISIGMDANGNGDGTIAIGRNSGAGAGTFHATGSIAIGDGSTVQNNVIYSLAIGPSAVTASDRSIAIGSNANVPSSFSESIALGTGSTVVKSNQIMLGRTNEVVTHPGGVEYAVHTATTAYTVDSSQKDYIILADATSGPFTITLPASSSNDGRTLTVKKIDATANAVTVDGSGAETIDGAASKSLSGQNHIMRLICDGSGWFIV